MENPKSKPQIKTPPERLRLSTYIHACISYNTLTLCAHMKIHTYLSYNTLRLRAQSHMK